MTAGSQNAQRLEHKPRQQLPAGRGSLDWGLLPMVQTTPQPHTPPSNLNQPGPLIISNPPPLLHKRLPNAPLADSTEIQHSPQLKKRGGARQEVTRVGQSGWLQAPAWLGPWRAGENVILSLLSYTTLSRQWLSSVNVWYQTPQRLSMIL